MAKDNFINFRVDGEVTDMVDKAAEILGGVSRSEAARFLVYLGIVTLDSRSGIEVGKDIAKAYERYIQDQEIKEEQKTG